MCPAFAQSLVPPTIVELNSSRVVLSWRTTRGPCSIRTEEEVDPTHSQEWANLEKDIKWARKKHSVKEAATFVSRVEVLEIDHVELQTCGCGCPQCLRGNEDSREPATGCSCPYCLPAPNGLGCWRPVYDGPNCWCQVKLQLGNALHYFRLFVRARLPPPERRGYRRPKHQAPPATTHETTRSAVDRCFDAISRRMSSTPRRRHGPYRPPGAAVTYGSDASNTPPSGSLARPGSPCKIWGHGVVAGSPRGAVVAPVDNHTTTTNEPVCLFASAPVFVDSRPPAVTLHGLGTALVLTWPPLTRFSGSEKVSYMLEQWSHHAEPVAGATTTTAMMSSPTRTTTASTVGGECHQSNQRVPHEQSGRRQHPRGGHHHHHYNPSGPKRADVKEIFSVGARCWFVPAVLQTGARYWYRLRFIHEGGSSVGGPWVSHVTSLAPPSCVDVGAGGLVLSLPRALNADFHYRNVGVGCAGRAACADGSSTDEELTAQPRYKSPMEYDPEQNGGRENSYLQKGETGLGTEKTQQSFVGKGVEARVHGREPDTPVAWYTLEGLERGSQWIVLYRGPNPNVLVEVR